jgi:hypothetical protein
MKRYRMVTVFDANDVPFVVAEPFPRGDWVRFWEAKEAKRFKFIARFDRFNEPYVAGEPDRNGNFVLYDEAMKTL